MHVKNKVYRRGGLRAKNGGREQNLVGYYECRQILLPHICTLSRKTINYRSRDWIGVPPILNLENGICLGRFWYPAELRGAHLAEKSLTAVFAED